MTPKKPKTDPMEKAWERDIKIKNPILESPFYPEVKLPGIFPEIISFETG